MYLHLGQSVVVPYGEILGIFDLDNASWAYKTREFLERAEQEGRYYHPAANGKIDEMTNGYSSEIQLASLLDNARLAGQIESSR